MKQDISRVVTGVEHLDQLLDGLYIGDNVIWYDNAGSLAPVFYLNFILASQAQGKPLIYVSFDRSPKNLLDKLGSLGDSGNLIILDCFTNGKGAGSDVFLKFYRDRMPDRQFLLSFLSATLRTEHGGLLDHRKASPFSKVAGTDQPGRPGRHRSCRQKGEDVADYLKSGKS